MTLSNGELAELFARAAAEEAAPHRRRALHRAARAAFHWPEEAASVAADPDRSLTELPAIGPWLARAVLRWLDDPPELAAAEPPELRRDFLTLSRARAVLAEHPEWRSELRADLQMHTTYSDGKAPLGEMVSAAASLGYEFVAITDHSKGLPIAGGMFEEELAREGREIDALNAELERSGERIRVIKSLEMNLSPEGEGDMEPDALGRLDLVLGAFHSKLRVTEDQTERYLAAVRNPDVHVLAHPRGRRFDVRLGLRADWRTVFEAAADASTAMEIDAYPDRQDLNVELLGLARDAETWISIGTDAHHPNELRFMELGLAAAILGGVRRERILNFLPRDELLGWARR